MDTSWVLNTLSHNRNAHLCILNQNCHQKDPSALSIIFNHMQSQNKQVIWKIGLLSGTQAQQLLDLNEKFWKFQKLVYSTFRVSRLITKEDSELVDMGFPTKWERISVLGEFFCCNWILQEKDLLQTDEAPLQSTKKIYSAFSIKCYLSETTWSVNYIFIPLLDSFLFLFFCFFRSAPVAYGSSQARGWIRAAAAGLHHRHSNIGSEPHLRPTPQLRATLDSQPAEWGQGLNHILMDTGWIHFHCATMGTPRFF